MNKYILGIETSCDDTSVAVLKNIDDKNEILSHVKYGQEIALAKWGGVVPEIAARNHLAKIAPTIQEALSLAKITAQDINLISVTTVPGLLGPLLTGLNAAKSMSLLYKTPIVAANHLYSHLEAIHLTEDIQYPYLGLLVSGGHSIFFNVENKNSFKVLGSTIDDAAGEAFDKGGKLLELGYPAGHIIDKLAVYGDETKVEFPIGLKSSADARLSFSGLKTALRNYLENNPSILNLKPSQFESYEKESQEFYDICASYQKAIIDALVLKMRYAIKKLDDKNPQIVIGGGVACNSYLRKIILKKYPKSKFVAPKFCTDNGAMIANYGMIHQDMAIHFPNTLELDARGRFINKKDFK